MPAEPTPPEDPVQPEAPPVVHQFTVLRGMAVAVVIETRDWYLGLLQAALAPVRLEGHNRRWAESGAASGPCVRPRYSPLSLCAALRPRAPACAGAVHLPVQRRRRA